MRGSGPQPNGHQPVHLNGIEKWARPRAGPGNAFEVVDVSLRHRGRPQIRIRQAEAASIIVQDRLNLDRTAFDREILHERDPAASSGLGDPRHIGDLFVRWHTVMLSQRHQSDAGIPEESRDLNAPETPINEDDRKRAHRSSGVSGGDPQGVL